MKAPLHIKFALVCLSKFVIPKWLGSFFFFLSHLQIIAIIIKTTYLALPDNTPSASPIIKLFVKLFVVGDWLDYRNTPFVVIGIVISALYTIKVVCLMVYIHLCLYHKRKIPELVQKYWSAVHSLHPLLLFFWIHTFCVNISEYPGEDRGRNGVRLAMMAIGYLTTAANCGLALFFSIILVIYKTKDAMSAKTNLLETKTIVFKILIPIIWRFAENNQRIQIFILVLIVVNAILHDWIFVKYLPYYRIRILLLSAILQSSATSLALISFIAKVIAVSRTKTIGVYSVWMIWLLALPIFAKLYYSFTCKLLTYILGCRIKDEKNLAYLVHKRWILLYFLKSRKAIHEGISRFSVADIMYQGRMAEIVESSAQITFEEFDVNKKLLIRSLRSICLEVLSLYPMALMAQISLANSFSNFEDLYLVSNNLLEDAISKRPGYQAQISLNLIRFELQKKLKIQFSEKSGEGLNVNSYIVNHQLFEEMKTRIKEQAQLQLDFWSEYSSNTAKMLNLINITYEVNEQRDIIRKLWNNLEKIRPASFLSPLTIYGMYSTLINNDPIEGEKYAEQLREDAKRMHKSFKADELTNETIFSEKSVKVSMSGLRASLGKILDCSSNMADFYGWQGSDLKERTIGSLMPPFFRQRHDGFLLHHYSTGKTRIINKTLMVPVKRSNGYIHASWLHAKASPFMSNGMSYVALLKPCKLSQRMVLVQKDGKIDDMCFGFAKDMNLVGRQAESAEIFSLCPEFRKINDAFNIIAENTIEANTQAEHKNESYSPSKNFPSEGEKQFIRGSQRNATNETVRSAAEPEISIEKFSVKKGIALPKMEKNKAQYIYDHFTAGSTLTFRPQNKTVQSVTYSAKIINSIHGQDVLKFILLEREDNSEEAQLSLKEDAFSSVQILAKKLYDDPQTDVLPSSPKLLQAQSSPVTYETERAELMLFTTSPRIKTDFKFSEPNNDDTDLSVLDEVQNDDFTARKTVRRKILSKEGSSSDNFSSYSPKKKSNIKIVEDQMFQTTIPTQSACVITEVNEVKPLNGAKIKKKAQTHRTLGKRNKKAGYQEDVIKREDVGINAAPVETSVGTSFGSKGKKVKQMVVRALKSEPKKRSITVFTSLSILFIILMIILLVIQNQNLHSGIDDVESQIPVMNLGYLRIYQMVSATSAVMIWMEALRGTIPFDWESFNNQYRAWLTWYAEMMHLYNMEFFQLLSKLPEEMQEKTYQKNVRFYEYDEDGTRANLIGKYSTFDAFRLMSEKLSSCLNQDIPDHFVPGIDTTNWQFIVDNTFNDLLIQADHQNTELVQELNNSTSFTTLKIMLTLAVVLVICLIFILASIRYLWVIASEMRIFMTILFRIKLQESKTTQLIIQHFISALNQNAAVMVQEKPQTILDSISNNPTRSVKFRKASMGSFYRTQRIMFLKFAPIYILFICWSIIYYFLTSDFLDNIKDSQKRMQAARDALNDQSLFVYQTLAIPLTNGMALIENKPIIPAYLKSLEILQQTDRFVNKFRDRTGKLTALQDKVLFGYPCDDFLPFLAESPTNYVRFIDAYWSCLNLQAKEDVIGVVYLRSKFVQNGFYFLEQYDESPKTEQDLKDLFMLVYSMNIDEMNVIEGLIDLLYLVTERHFHEQVDSIQTNALHFVIATIMVTLIAVWMTWVLIIKKIFKIQNVDWLILQIIPVHLILDNKHLQQYLLRRSAGMLDGVKNYL